MTAPDPDFTAARIDVDVILERIETDVRDNLERGEQPDDASWGDEEGVLLSNRQATILAAALRRLREENQRLREALPVILERDYDLSANESSEVLDALDRALTGTRADQEAEALAKVLGCRSCLGLEQCVCGT